MKKLLFIGLLAAMGCSNTQCAHAKAFGSDGDIICYSGGKVIYEGKSNGKIDSESTSDGWMFMDSQTKRLVRVSGDCVIKN